MKRISYVLLLAFFASPVPAQQKPVTTDQWKPVEQALGRSGERQPDGAIKFAFPRSDLKMSVNGAPVATGLALGGWVAFYGSASGEAMTMGDLVVTEDELPNVMSKLLGSTVEVTAVHNHLLSETPRVMYVHISGRGKATDMAQTIAAALAMTSVPPPVGPAANAAALPVDQKKMETCVGAAGKVKVPVMSFSVPTAGPVMEHGGKVPASAGLNTAINLQFVSADRALGTGDFVLPGDRVNPVAKALMDGGIRVTALHSHMLDESPRLFFMHFWADGAPDSVCATLRKALDAARK